MTYEWPKLKDFRHSCESKTSPWLKKILILIAYKWPELKDFTHDVKIKLHRGRRKFSILMTYDGLN